MLGTENYCLIDCIEKNSKFLECPSQSIRDEGRILTQQHEGKTLHILLKCEMYHDLISSGQLTRSVHDIA